MCIVQLLPVFFSFLPLPFTYWSFVMTLVSFPGHWGVRIEGETDGCVWIFVVVLFCCCVSSFQQYLSFIRSSSSLLVSKILRSLLTLCVQVLALTWPVITTDWSFDRFSRVECLRNISSLQREIVYHNSQPASDCINCLSNVRLCIITVSQLLIV